MIGTSATGTAIPASTFQRMNSQKCGLNAIAATVMPTHPRPHANHWVGWTTFSRPAKLVAATMPAKNENSNQVIVCGLPPNQASFVAR